MNSSAHNMYVVDSQLKSFKLARAERKFQVNYSDMSVNSHILILDFSFYLLGLPGLNSINFRDNDAI